MTKEELVARLRDIEWEDFEVKTAKSDLPKNIWETVSAFSNTSGGWIVLGVKQSGRTFDIQGVNDIEKLEQDFNGTLRSCIRVYTDHIEFMNGGAFPLPVNEILGKVYSKLRNPTIAKLFRYAGIAENAGYGMNKLASWESLTGTKPIIESSRTIATVTFPLKSAIQRFSSDNSNVGKNVGKTITLRQRQIMNLIKSNNSISMAEMASAIGVTTRTIEREITKMTDLISHIGPKNGGYWNIR